MPNSRTHAMASCSPRFTWCACRKHKIPSKDTHELCLHCLGIQHAKEAVLEYGKCPHCAKMDWSTCINRLTKVQEVIYRENQLKKTEAAQSEAQPKPETTLVPVSESKVTKDPVPAPPPAAPLTATPVASSTVPVMFTILSPPPVQTEANPSILRGAHPSPLAVQQSGAPASSLAQASPDLVRASRSHKRRHFPTCHSRCSKRAKRSHGHRRRRAPSSSLSSSPSWSSSDSSCSSARQERKCRRVKLERQQSRLLELVQQKLEAQQQAIQAQWTLLEKRIEALEKKTAEPQAAASASVTAQTAPPASALPSTSSQERQQEAELREESGPSTDAAVREPSLPCVVKQEEEPTSISARANGEVESEGEGEEAPLLPEDPLSRQDLLTATELQSLIARAAKYLGIDFPSTPGSPSSPDPTMVPEFEELVQSTWSNPASSRPFREVFSKMYRLHDCQAPAYDRMPQVNRFMSAIFQAVKPSEPKEAAMPAERWRFTETLAERVYQTAGMLARTANYLRYLSDYQKRLLVEITEDRPAQRFVTVLNELKLIGQFAFQLSSHQAELSGRVMASSVAIRRQVWMAKTNYTDALKATVADLPFVVSHTFEAGVGAAPSDAVCKQETS
ncbi:uncharacterized protein LOC118778456 [Megalops cyprinoides]|uniref:uncharacterized protein LOC118778456 n=1 Tax=Megalops cyprinoides TaxID=118141 RepID=UPI0018641D3D|nr:uncharacterized protein LOC118778456 [Megalops cyprinoides]